MKKLNNKGITTIEIIICFVLVIGITISMYSVISSFNEKKIIETHKEELTTYKDTLIKDIQDDFVKIGITSCEITTPMTNINTLDCTMKDNTHRYLKIYKGTYNANNHMITYGKAMDEIEYPLPELGDVKVEIDSINITKENNILHIHIGLYHPDLGKKYAIDIVDPFNY